MRGLEVVKRAANANKFSNSNVDQAAREGRLDDAAIGCCRDWAAQAARRPLLGSRCAWCDWKGE